VSTRGQTARRKADFLAEFRKQGNVTLGAERSGTTRSAVYKWKVSDRKFAAAFADAELEATERLEGEAHRRAVEGVESTRPIYHRVESVEKIEYSDTLLIFLLKARDPAKYRERLSHELTGEGGNPLRIVIEDGSATGAG
jgi:hypothetical protein